MFSRRKCLNTSRNRGREDISFKILETKRYFCKNKYYVARVPKINIMLSVPKINIMLRSENSQLSKCCNFTHEKIDLSFANYHPKDLRDRPAM